jgi:hypothetical protein
MNLSNSNYSIINQESKDQKSSKVPQKEHLIINFFINLFLILISPSFYLLHSYSNLFYCFIEEISPTINSPLIHLKSQSFSLFCCLYDHSIFIFVYLFIKKKN